VEIAIKKWYYMYMKKLLTIIIVICIILGIFYLTKKEVIAPVVKEVQSTELCFAKFGIPDKNGFYDKHTLRLTMTGEKATGELKFLPAEKDALVGKFAGTVGAVDKATMTRTANLMWDTQGEGMNATQELKIIFGEGIASIGFGEMKDRGDGIYMYKDPAKVDYSFSLTNISCLQI
jgi:hypothetical protein